MHYIILSCRRTFPLDIIPISTTGAWHTIAHLRVDVAQRTPHPVMATHIHDMPPILAEGVCTHTLRQKAVHGDVAHAPLPVNEAPPVDPCRTVQNKTPIMERWAVQTRVTVPPYQCW